MFSVNRFSINRTETENGGQDGVMQNAVMHIEVHQYLIVKIIPLSHRLCTRLCTLIHTTGSLLIYHMKGKQLEEINSEKDLGVIISSNLKVADHCRHAYATANRICWVFFRDSQIQEC